MLRKPVVMLFVACVALMSGVGLYAAETPPASQWIGPDAVAVLEISHPRALMDLFLDSSLSQTVTSSPAYQAQTSTPQFQQFLGVVKFFEGSLGTGWRTGLGKVLGGGVTVALYPRNTVVMMIEAEDAKMLADLHEMMLNIARGEAAKNGHPERVASAQYRDVQGWTFSKNEAHAIIGNRLVMANKPEALKSVLDLRAASEGRSLASLPAYQAARQAVGNGVEASLFVNLEVLNQLPAMQKALAKGENPGVALLLGGAAETLRGSTWMELGLSVQENGLKLQAVVDGQPPEGTSLMAFAESGRGGEGALPIPSVPRQIAGLTFYRDLHAFYAAKDELFPERTSGLIFFENMMGIFFTGRDLTEEVLGETRPEIRFVVAGQAYDPAVGTPAVQFPAFAAIFRLRDPEKFGTVVEEAWQKAIGLMNFTRGQQALPGLIIDRATRRDVKYTVAYFAPPEGQPPAAGVDVRFNFRPSLALVGDYLVLSSTDGLAGDLIDALSAEREASAKPLAGTNIALMLDAKQLGAALRANLESLVSQNMLKEGSTHAQAESQFEAILTVLDALGQVRLDMGTHADRPQATLTVSRP